MTHSIFSLLDIDDCVYCCRVNCPVRKFSAHCYPIRFEPKIGNFLLFKLSEFNFFLLLFLEKTQIDLLEKSANTSQAILDTLRDLAKVNEQVKQILKQHHLL